LAVSGLRGISPAVVDGVNAIAGYLAVAFGLTLGVDLVFLLIIWAVLLPTRWFQGADLWSGT